MPVAWLEDNLRSPARCAGTNLRDGHKSGPVVTLRLWPHRSLTKPGFAAFIGVTFALSLLPLLAVLGTPVLWGLLPFILAMIALVWWCLQRSYRDGDIVEELTVWPDRALLIRRQAGLEPRSWEANPHWVRVHLHPRGGPVQDYLTLSGAGREVELGAFLTREERGDLHRRLSACLATIR